MQNTFNFPVQNAKFSMVDLADRLALALAWLTKLGIRYNVTRFGSYSKQLNAYVGGSPEAQLKTSRYESEMLNNAVIEATDLVTIHRALSERDERLFIDRLRKVCGGPDTYVGEVENSAAIQARNFGFELRLIARLILNGAQVDEAALSDVGAVFGNRLVLIECKRLQSSRSASNNATDALNQIRNNHALLARPRVRGLIAMDISKAVNPNFDIIPFNRESSIEDSLAKQAMFVTAQIVRERRFKGASYVLGGALFNRQVFMIPDGDLYYPIACELLSIHPGASIIRGGSDEKLLFDLTASLGITERNNWTRQ